MCAINPRFKKRILFDFYTSHPTMTEEEFNNIIVKYVLKLEEHSNRFNPSIRLHVKETDQKAD